MNGTEILALIRMGVEIVDFATRAAEQSKRERRLSPAERDKIEAELNKTDADWREKLQRLRDARPDPENDGDG